MGNTATVAYAGVVKPVYDSLPISGPGATYAAVAAGDFYMFQLATVAGGSDGSSKIFLEKETTTTASVMRAAEGTDITSLTITYDTRWYASDAAFGTYLNIGPVVKGSPGVFTATLVNTN